MNLFEKKYEKLAKQREESAVIKKRLKERAKARRKEYVSLYHRKCVYIEVDKSVSLNHN